MLVATLMLLLFRALHRGTQSANAA
jgi:hypothetical protein